MTPDRGRGGWIQWKKDGLVNCLKSRFTAEKRKMVDWKRLRQTIKRDMDSSPFGRTFRWDLVVVLREYVHPCAD